jgi:hypothetical protein
MKLKNAIKCISYVGRTQGTDKGYLLIGSGDGRLTKFDIFKKKPINSCSLKGSCTSIALETNLSNCLAATANCNIYLIDIFDFRSELR